jgi:hypothetical protein
LLAQIERLVGAGADHRRVILPIAEDVGPIGEAARRVLPEEARIVARGIGDRPFGIAEERRFFRPLVARGLGPDLGRKLRRWRLVGEAGQPRGVDGVGRQEAVSQARDRY